MSNPRGGGVSRRSESMRVLFALVASAIVLSAVAPPARAGSYDVYSCDPSHANGGTPGWDGFHDPGLTVYSDCAGAAPQGIATYSVRGDHASSSAFQGAFAVFDAPDGTI